MTTTGLIPRSLRNSLDECLYVLRWTTAKSREASPALFVARALFSVVHGLFVILRCLAIWWGVDWLMAALEDPQQSGQMLIRLALLAGALMATEAVGRQIAYWLGSRAGFHLELLLRREFIAKSAELDLAEIEAAGERDLLENRHSLEHTACGVMNSIYSFIYFGVQAVGLIVLCTLIGWPIFAAAGALLVVQIVGWLTRSKESRGQDWAPLSTWSTCSLTRILPRRSASSVSSPISEAWPRSWPNGTTASNCSPSEGRPETWPSTCPSWRSPSVSATGSSSR